MTDLHANNLIAFLISYKLLRLIWSSDKNQQIRCSST